MTLAWLAVALLTGPLRAIWRGMAEYYRWQGRIEGALFAALLLIGLHLVFRRR